MKTTVKDLIGRAAVLAGKDGLAREVRSPQVNRPRLSQWETSRDVASSIVHLQPAEAAHLCKLPKGERLHLARAIMRKHPAAIVLSGAKICRDLLDAADRASIPVFKSGNVPRIARTLEERLSPRVGLHGVLVQIFGVGMLIIGESAIGKSEAALDLVLRGHKLVADDVVMLERNDGGILGGPTDIGRDLLEIRGLGIINVRALYGESATTDRCDVGMVVELDEWKKGVYYSLLGLREQRYRVLGVNLPYLKLPVKPGRNMATLIEVAARNQMLKRRGIYTARELDRRLKQRLTR
ncbi:MAG: HPr(Ser) kinase/phosphatase [Nitrospiraceae bacterium]|nr:HPr(Ser) kinase/phosphatase [Nitrospiraceae bacterium]